VQEQDLRLGSRISALAGYVVYGCRDHDGLGAGVVANNPQAMYHAAYSLKGAAGNFGTTAVVEAAWVLEGMGRQGDLSDAPTAVVVLEQELPRLRLALTSLTTDSAA
jgi:HPt (histidine-containing phosphotransfer) domain-containing protein